MKKPLGNRSAGEQVRRLAVAPRKVDTYALSLYPQGRTPVTMTFNAI